jgi:hypothetical protein
MINGKAGRDIFFLLFRFNAQKMSALHPLSFSPWFEEKKWLHQKILRCVDGATTFSITALSIMTLSIMTLSIMTLSIMTLSIMTLSIKGLFATLSITTFSMMALCIMKGLFATFSIMTFSIMTLNIKGLFATFSIMTFSINDTQHNSISTIMPSFIMLNVAFYLCLC